MDDCPTRPGHWPGAINAGRFASLIQHDSADGCRVALLGLPDDTGVGLNGGRVGAAGGPDAFRAALACYGAAEPSGFAWPGVFDAGDVEPTGDLDRTHDRVSQASEAIVRSGLIPVGIGGGHDLTYALVRGVIRGDPGRWAGVYFDAHLDVRPDPGSGMSFRRLVEDCGVCGLYVHGLDPLVNSREHLRWFEAHGGRIDAFEPTDSWPIQPGDRCFVSLDLDVIDASFAPGVSATNPNGWSPDLAGRWAEAAGRHPAVRCMDIMELNPAFDPDGRTARLAAHLFLRFLRGLAGRED